MIYTYIHRVISGVTILKREVVKIGENVEVLARALVEHGSKATTTNSVIVEGLEKVDSKAMDAIRSSQVSLNKIGVQRVRDPAMPAGTTLWEGLGRVRGEVSTILDNGFGDYA